ncbi:hypothetical protein CYY_004076 [Polysphondylium violaceum]|uniref:Uncharacterized protein n=1 Tax=Polysphondylium violaceum TaxID=133409 RepID=A0A8J4Q607_9MYCE|nr:hypothetical protein CYY_004076 [Polysphondylium violaceum]
MVFQCKRQHTFFAKDRINQRNGSSKNENQNNSTNLKGKTTGTVYNNKCVNLVGYSDDDDDDHDGKINNYSDHHQDDADDHNLNNHDQDFLTIVISQNEDSNDYAHYIWDCSIVLSFFIWSKDYKEFWSNKVSLEIGSGVSLPSILLTKLHLLNNTSNSPISKLVIITDRNDNSFTEIKNNIITSCNLNEIHDLPLILPFSYGDNNLNNDEIVNVDYLFVSDCFYDNTIDYDNIFSTFYYFFQKNNKLKIYLTYQLRCVEKSISSYLNKWGIKASLIDNDSFLPNRIISLLKSEIFLYQLELQA